jgi:adenylate cyclase
MTATLDRTTSTGVEGLRRERITVGFADLGGFMKAVEGVSDAEIGAALQDAYTQAGDAIVRHGGRILKYLGDAILFRFDDAPGAVRAAHEIAATGPFRAGADAPEMRFHVALATGDVVSGTFGHSSLRGEDMFGHVIHRAATTLLREAKQRPDHVALDDDTAAAAR